ncbi:MAG: hypothetical protein INF01_13700 [Phenylobacterium sp.]|nr:hypothetical protein [Phenylobacterium sp.]
MGRKGTHLAAGPDRPHRPGPVLVAEGGRLVRRRGGQGIVGDGFRRLGEDGACAEGGAGGQQQAAPVDEGHVGVPEDVFGD